MRQGAALIEQAACRRCHTIDGTGNAQATEPGAVAWTRSQDELLAAIERPVDQMPRFGFDRRQAETLIAYLIATRRRAGAHDAYRVRFSGEKAIRSSPFEERCGPCHRMLTPAGALGAGADGPNLSGLFTRFYPATAQGDRRWSPQSLRTWLSNPRAVRPATTMPPGHPTDDDIAAIVAQLAPSGGPSPSRRSQ